MSRTASTTLGVFILLTAFTGCRHSAKGQPDVPPPFLVVGTPLPALDGVDQNGSLHHLPDSAGHPVVVYFFPKDNTPGCTKEACAFRDAWQRYQQAGVVVYGVSRDDRASHGRFAREHHLPFPLIADTDGRWAKAFGVPEVPGHAGMSSRVSFLFDAEGKLRRVYPNVDPGEHAVQVLSDAVKVRGS
jgi:peroxiredoxin Q/BCP